MKQVGAFEAKTHLSELIERVFTHREIIEITRRGTPVVRLVPIPAKEMEGRRAQDSLVAAAKRIRDKSKPGVSSLKEMIEEGRKY